MVQPIIQTRWRTRPSAFANLFGSEDLNRTARCTFIVAHPGDEIVGAGCLISKLDDIDVVYVTDGADTSQTQSAAERDRLANARKRECLSALSLVRVSPDRVADFGLAVDTAALSLPFLSRTFATLLQSSGADIVVTHPYEGGHPDHDATAFAVHTAVRLIEEKGFKPPVVFEMALHPTADGNAKVTDFLPDHDWETTTLVLDQASEELKQRMIDCLHTQRECLKSSPIGVERFRKPRKYDFNAPPKPDGLHYENFYESFGSDDWQLLARRALAELFGPR